MVIVKLSLGRLVECASVVTRGPLHKHSKKTGFFVVTHYSNQALWIRLNINKLLTWWVFCSKLQTCSGIPKIKLNKSSRRITRVYLRELESKFS